MANEIIVSEQAQQFLPVMSMAVALQRYNMTVEFTKQIMRPGVDYGVVPGTGNKPTLLKPGAEKLCSFFGLSPVFVPVETVQDWSGAEHDGEAFFLYRYRCELYRNGTMIGSGVGSCNSWEVKYRYRSAQRVCPSCGQAAIIKGKDEYGGGWLCFKSKGGCGAKFKDGDRSIEGQVSGKVKNTDPADIVNTVDKMAQKRALVAATLIAVNASEFYTQDVEDMAGGYIDAEFTVTVPEPPKQKQEQEKPEPPKQNGKATVEPQPKANGNGKESTPQTRLHGQGVSTFGPQKWDEARHAISRYLTGDDSSSALTDEMKDKIADAFAHNRKLWQEWMREGFDIDTLEVRLGDAGVKPIVVATDTVIEF